jgi:predicted patatin/cPLA2 family phospholipase
MEYVSQKPPYGRVLTLGFLDEGEYCKVKRFTMKNILDKNCILQNTTRYVASDDYPFVETGVVGQVALLE